MAGRCEGLVKAMGRFLASPCFGHAAGGEPLRRMEARRTLEDGYLDGSYRWWHLSLPSPELTDAIASGWFPNAGRVLDVGCGAGSELSVLEGLGIDATGIDLSLSGLRMAREQGATSVASADAARLPFADGVFDAALDRGCFHYLAERDRTRYARELRRVLRPDAPFLLRACTRSEGHPNGVDEPAIAEAFAGWTADRVADEEIASDTRSMPALVCYLRAPV